MAASVQNILDTSYDDLASLSSVLRKIPLKNIHQVVGTSFHFWLDGSGIKSRWGQDFPNPSIPFLGSTKPPVQRVFDLFPGVKQSECGFKHPPPSSIEVKNRVKPYLYSPSGSSWPVRMNFTF
jgi:hypothetical protein